MLSTDDSPYALCPDTPELLEQMVVAVGSARADGIPNGTKNADEWGFKWLVRYGEATGNRWMRPREATTYVDRTREEYFYPLAIVWIAQMMNPSARRAKSGFTQAQPTSTLNAVYGHMRVMRDCSRHRPDTRIMRDTLKGLCAQYKQIFGNDAFVPQRAQPFALRHLLEMAGLLADNQVVGWASPKQAAMLAMCTHGGSTGTRKDEEVGDDALRRANFWWVDANGVPLPRTSDVLLTRRNGDMLCGRSTCSKCDRLNTEWGAKLQWFRLDDTNPLNFAWRWLQYERRFPCPSGREAEWPAFSPYGDARPFSSREVDSSLKTLMRLVMTEEEVDAHSWHSYRVTLAMAIMAMVTTNGRTQAKKDEAEAIAQALCRWKSIEAVRIYARWNPADYADYVDTATRTDASLTHDIDMPEVNPTDVIRELEATIAALGGSNAKAQRVSQGDAEVPSRTHKKAKVIETAEDASTVGKHMATHDLGNGVVVNDVGVDPWGVLGTVANVHHSFWGLSGNSTSACRVVGYIGNFKFPGGGRSPHTYIIEEEGNKYPIRHSALAAALDAATRSRLQKAPLPRVTGAARVQRRKPIAAVGARRPPTEGRSPGAPAPRRQPTVRIVAATKKQATKAPTKAAPCAACARPRRIHAASGVTRFLAGPAQAPSAAHKQARRLLAADSQGARA